MRFRAIMITSISVTLMAAALWGIAIAGIWGSPNPVEIADDQTGAAVSTLTAVMLWAVRRRDRRDRDRAARDQERAILIKTLAAVAPAPGREQGDEPEGPFPRAL